MPSRRTFLFVILPTWIVIGALAFTFRDALRNISRVADGTIEIDNGLTGLGGPLLPGSTPLFNKAGPVEIAVPKDVPFSIATREYGWYLDGYRDGFAAQRWWQGG